MLKKKLAMLTALLMLAILSFNFAGIEAKAYVESEVSGLPVTLYKSNIRRTYSSKEAVKDNIYYNDGTYAGILYLSYTSNPRLNVWYGYYSGTVILHGGPYSVGAEIE